MNRKNNNGDKLASSAFETIKKYNMLAGAKTVLAAFSGGADSTALLHYLLSIKDKYGIKIEAAHLNHGIRAEEADRDQQFCVDFCESRAVKLHVRNADIPRIARLLGKTLEEAARDERYAFFESICNGDESIRIATAHHADDNMETVLLNLVRGTSGKGISGIPPVRGRIIRPFIACPSELISEYCRQNDLPFVIDSTNTDTEYTRNFIRHEILPLVKKINPRAAEAVTRFSELQNADSACLEEIAADIDKSAKIDEINALPLPIASRYVRQRFAEKAPDGVSLDSKHTLAILQLVERGKANSRLSLPGKMTVLIEGGMMSFFSEKELAPIYKKNEKPIEFLVKLSQGENHISETGDCIYLVIGEEGEREKKDINRLKIIYKLFIHTTVCSDRIKEVFFARSRREGDKYRLGGMTRSIKKLFQSADVTLSERGCLPFICCTSDINEIIWIPGFDVSDGWNCRFEDSDNTVHFYYFKEPC